MVFINIFRVESFRISSANMVLKSILPILLLIFHCENVLTTKIQIDRVEILNSTYKEGFYNYSEVQVTRINRTAYVYNVQLTLYKDIDEDWEVEVAFYHNRLNNNQYYKTPFSIPRQSCCQLLEQHYKTIIQPVLKGVSNFPQFKTDEHVCPIKKVYIP